MNDLISILIPTYNQSDTFEKIVKLYSSNSKVKIIVSDDSDDLKIKEKIKAICLEKNLSYFKGPQTSAINNWNFLLSLVETPFFVLNHHDDYPNNLFFLDYLDNIDPDKTGLVLLPCTSYICNKPHVRVSSRHQKIHIALFRYFPNPMFNIFLAPTASVIVNSKLKENNFDNDLKWYVDCEWYLKLLFATRSQKLDILFFKNSRIISNQTKESITNKIKNKLLEIKKYEICKLKRKNLIPNKFISLIQKVFSLFLIFDSKIIRLINSFNFHSDKQRKYKFFE